MSSAKIPNQTFPMTDENCNLVLYPSQGQCEIQRYDYLTLVKTNETVAIAGSSTARSGSVKTIKPTKRPCPNKWFPLPVAILTGSILAQLIIVWILSLFPVKLKTKKLIVSLVSSSKLNQSLMSCSNQ